MTEPNYWGGTDMIFQCLIDKKRTLAFEKIIKETVKKGDVVADFGSGSGILSLCATNAGASKVYAIEADTDVIKTLKKTIAINGLEETVILLEGDATQIKLPEEVDVVICEMIATGLLDELQIPVMNNALDYCKKDAKIIPFKMQNFVDLVHTDDRYYGYKLAMVQYEYGYCDESGRTSPKSMTNKHMYKEIDFSKKNEIIDIDLTVPLKANQDGVINGLRITNNSLFTNGDTLGGTPAYCMPLIMPIDELTINDGDEILVHLSYSMCKGLHTLNFSIQSN